MNKPSAFTIAIVDDDPLYRKMLIYLLRKHQFIIHFEAENGHECLSKMDTITYLPHLIILDVEMPVMDGFETARRLREKWPQVKIIAHSAILDISARDKMKAAGADYFLAKGLESMRIAEAIRLLLNED